MTSNNEHDAAVTDKLLWEVGLPVSCARCGEKIPYATGPHWCGWTGEERPYCQECYYDPESRADMLTRSGRGEAGG